MVQFTQEELGVIQRYPLGETFSGFRQALSDAESSQADENADEGPERPRLFVAVIEKLLMALLTLEAATLLRSRTGENTLAFDLLAVRVQLQKGRLAHKHLRPLARLVINQAGDVDIWTAVIILVKATLNSTPPSSFAPSSFGTPIAASSASQQGSDQTRQKIELRVFEEIRHCTHRAVGQFHEKYFQGREWNGRAQDLWERGKCHYDDTYKRWKRLSNRPSEDEVCTWLLGLQQELLANERAAYFRSTASNKVGTEARRQLDLLVKMKGLSDRHVWEDVLIVGELKRSEQSSKALWLQIGSAVRNVFAAQPTRRFVHAFSLTRTEMETWVFDRSGPSSGATFNIHDEPDKFFQVMCGYLMMSDEEYGLDTLTKTKDGKLYITMPIESNGKKSMQQLELYPTPIAHQRAIVCRGTSCFLARDPNGSHYDMVVKFSWTPSQRPPEVDLLIKAHERGVQGLAKVIGYYTEVTSISSLRQGLVFSAPHKFRAVPDGGGSSSFSQLLAPQSLTNANNASRKRNSTSGTSQVSKRSRSTRGSLPDKSDDADGVTYPIQETQGDSLVERTQDQAPFENRILRVLAISPAGRSISQFTSVVELLETLRDAIRGHRSLYLDGKILHRDISENNIIITDPNTAHGFKGILIDLDLAKEEGKGPSGARHRTGTMQFMAIEVLLGISHTFRHDLEGFFYVLLWLSAIRGWALPGAPRNPGASGILYRWYTGTFEDIATVKLGNMTGSGLELILKRFPPDFDCVKPLCRILRGILFPSCRTGIFVGTPQDPASLYDSMIDAFEEAVTEIREMETAEFSLPSFILHRGIRNEMKEWES